MRVRQSAQRWMRFAYPPYPLVAPRRVGDGGSMTCRRAEWLRGGQGDEARADRRADRAPSPSRRRQWSPEVNSRGDRPTFSTNRRTSNHGRNPGCRGRNPDSQAHSRDRQRRNPDSLAHSRDCRHHSRDSRVHSQIPDSLVHS